MNPYDAPGDARARRHADLLTELRRRLARRGAGVVRTPSPVLAFGIPALDRHLPQGGLAFGALHEICADHADLPAAFGFVAALLGRLPQTHPLLIVTGPKALQASLRTPPPRLRLHGHGLARLGLDPARLILVEAADDQQALWTLEQSLRAGVPAAGAIASRLDLKASQRLQLAAETARLPLLLLHPLHVADASVAVTRWRVAAAPAVRDRYGLVAQWRWQLRLTRCRNGRAGLSWLVEFDHAYRFSLAAALADPAFPGDTDRLGSAEAG